MRGPCSSPLGADHGEGASELEDVALPVPTVLQDSPHGALGGPAGTVHFYGRKKGARGAQVARGKRMDEAYTMASRVPAIDCCFPSLGSLESLDLSRRSCLGLRTTPECRPLMVNGSPDPYRTGVCP